MPAPIGAGTGAGRALLVVALATLGFMVGVATPAWAHATLLSSDPADGTSVPTGPASITLRFSEHVLVDTDAVRVVAGSGDRVDTADAHTVGAGDTVVAGLRGGLATGTYLVSWHVISADTHPVSGGFSFGVGVTPAAYSAAGGGVSGLDVVGAAGRTLVYAGLVLAVGVGAFLAAVWPAGRSRRRYRRLLGWGLVLLATGTVVEFLVQGAAGVGGGLGALMRPSLVADTAGSYLGHLLALRLLLVVMAAIALRARAWASLTRPELALLGVGLAGTVALAGHAHSGSDQLLAGASWTLHVLAMAVWLGGLTVLVAATWRRHARPEHGADVDRGHAAMVTPGAGGGPRPARHRRLPGLAGSPQLRRGRPDDLRQPAGGQGGAVLGDDRRRVRQLRAAAPPLHRRRRRRLRAARDLWRGPGNGEPAAGSGHGQRRGPRAPPTGAGRPRERHRGPRVAPAPPLPGRAGGGPNIGCCPPCGRRYGPKCAPGAWPCW